MTGAPEPRGRWWTPPGRWGRAAGLSGRLGLAVVLAFVVVAALAPLLSPHDPREFTGEPLQAPDPTHWLGTNDLGQDILSELIYSARTSVLVGLTVGACSMLIALAVALAAGVYGGWVDRLLMYLAGGFLSIPRLPLIIVLAVFLGASIWNIIFVLVLVSWAKGARVIRSQVLALTGEAYVEAVVLMGASRGHIIARHILPEVLPLGAYKFIKSAGHALVAEAGLAFIGLGDPAVKSWGMMFYHVQSYPGIYYTDVWLWWFLPPALCLLLLLLGLLALQYSVEGLVAPGRSGARA